MALTYIDYKATVKEPQRNGRRLFPGPSTLFFRECPGGRSDLDDVDNKVFNPAFPHLSGGDRLETLLGRPLEVEVRDSVDKALKILKQKMSKEGILQEIKRRRYYEKPSVKRKRKMREARKRRRREAKRRVIR